jgi:2-aminobenzoate-CoA ligase
MTAHLDLFVQQHLPAQKELPDFINLENFDYPEILNCATPLLDDAVKEGYGSKEVVLMNEGSWCPRLPSLHVSHAAEQPTDR